MNELTTAIKFVGAGNGGGGTSDGVDAATSSVATGDITMLIAGIIALFIGALAIWATVAFRKRAVEGAHIVGSNGTFMPLIAAAVAIVLGLGLTIASTSSIKAHAEGAITTTPCIGIVDEQTGSVTFSDVTLTNNSEETQLIQEFNFEAADGVTSLNDVVWTFEAEGETLFKGKFGDPVEEGWFPLPVPAGYSSIISVSATGISPEVAKSLINKNVAVCKTGYEEYSSDCKVSYGVAPSSDYGTLDDNSSITVSAGTEYSVADNVITVGTHTVTATPNEAEGHVFVEWYVGETPAESSGYISENTEITALFGDQPAPIFVTLAFTSSDTDKGTINKSSVSIEKGTGFSIDKSMISFDASSAVIEATPKEGYNFSCWKIDEQTISDGDHIASEDKTIVAYFEAVTYEVTFATYQGEGTIEGTPQPLTLSSSDNPTYAVSNNVITITSGSNTYTYTAKPTRGNFVNWHG